MNRFRLILTIILLAIIITPGLGQILQGTIRDIITGESVVNAHVIDLINGNVCITDEAGTFSVRSKSGFWHLVFSSVGHSKDSLSLSCKKDTMLVINLKPIDIDVIEVSSYLKLHKQTLLGKIPLSPEYIEGIPSLVGEPDLIRSVSFLPGVQANIKGFSTISVRGGGRQNNLFVIDGAPILLSNHTWGFLSPFNVDIIKSVDFYKGGFPARFGGKTASVFDIVTKDGNRNFLTGKLNVGLLQTRVFLEGPIGNDKTTFVIALRTSYLDWLSWPIKIIYNLRSKSGQFVGYTFLDFNFKLTHNLNKKNKVFVSSYFGRDNQKVFEKSRDKSIDNRFQYKQNNGLLTLGQQTILSANFSIKNSLIFSYYNNSYSTEGNSLYVDYVKYNKQESVSSITDLSANSQINYQPNNNHFLRAGIIAKKIINKPRSLSFVSEDAISFSDSLIGNNDLYKPWDFTFYIEDEWKVGNNISANLGVRGNWFKLGTDDFRNLAPRFSFRWMIFDDVSYKIGFSRMYQNMHVLSNNMQGIGSELWLSSSEDYQPEMADQISSGIFGYVKSLDLEYGFEIYYKKSKNLLELFYNEPDDLLNENIDELIFRNGRGKSYGLETQVKKQWPSLTTFISYTLSRNLNSFEQINNGAFFPNSFDRTHDINLFAQFNISDKELIGCNFVFSTGTPITLPIGYFKGNPLISPYYVYSGYNNSRLPAYHRLDLSYTRKWTSKKGRPSHWSINIYNAYARKNAIYMYFSEDKVYKTSLFPFLPSFSYGFKF